MDRRHFTVTLVLGVLGSPTIATAQQKEGVQRIGVLMTTPSPRCLDALRQELREHGWMEGRNTAIEYRTAEGIGERLPALAGELTRLNVKLIVAASNAEIAAVKAVSGATIPVVSVGMLDPIGSEFIASYAKPNGNVTGLTSDVTQQEPAKRLELFREAAPTISRVAILWTRAARGTRTTSTETSLAAERLGLTLYPVEVRLASDIDRAFSTMKRQQVDAVSVLSAGVLATNRRQVIQLAMQSGLPVLSYDRDYALAGALMSYGPSYRDLCRRSATYVDKILKGAKAGDLPVEQPTKYELVINLKTAKALGLTIPRSLLARADQVIE